MPNFQNETTITRPRQDVINFGILERRQDVLNAYKEYKAVAIIKQSYDEKKLGLFASALLTLAEEIRAMLEKEIEKEKDKVYNKYSELVQDIESNEEEDILRAWHYIDQLLYDKGLTKADTKEQYDKDDAFAYGRRFLGRQ